MTSENDILKKAAEALSAQTGLQVLPRLGQATSRRLEITIPQEPASQTTSYTVQVKETFSQAWLGETMLTARRQAAPPLLVTKHVTQPQAEKMRAGGICFMDAAGNAYLHAPGIFVFISGKKPALSAAKPVSLFSPAGIRLLLACFTKPGLENKDYRTIAVTTGVTRTTVGRLLNDLAKSGYLIKRGGNRRFLTRKAELITRWVFAYSEEFRVSLNPVRFHATKFSGRWWEQLDLAPYQAVWGGETGGAQLTNHLKPQNATLYAASKLPQLQAKYGLIRDEKGELEILQKFWQDGEIGLSAPPLVVYADLLATADERNLETAQLIYDRYLAPLTEENP